MKTSWKHQRVDYPFLTRTTWMLLVMMVLGIGACAYRFVVGLGNSTNLSNHYPWGIWKGLSVAAGFALATGGFITAALVHVFHRKRYESLVRPALLIALLGYTFGQVSLLIDLGRYYNIWHPAIPSMWQGDSVLFEVAMCVMLYSVVLWLEFLPILCEQYMGRVSMPGKMAVANRFVEAVLSGGHRFAEKTLGVFLLIGTVLSCMHHSSLGGLMLIARYKIHPLWYTPVLPLLFLLSVFPVGLAMVILVCLPLRRRLARGPDLKMFASLSRYVLIGLGVYGLAKVTDVVIRDAYVYLWQDPWYGGLWAAEVVLGVLVPLILLASARLRRSLAVLPTACGLAVLGLIMNRMNVFLVSYRPRFATSAYFPSLPESLVTAGLVAAFSLLFLLAIRYLPIWPAEPLAPDTKAHS